MNQLLTEMDGVGAKKNVFIIGTTQATKLFLIFKKPKNNPPIHTYYIRF